VLLDALVEHMNEEEAFFPPAVAAYFSKAKEDETLEVVYPWHDPLIHTVCWLTPMESRTTSVKPYSPWPGPCDGQRMVSPRSAHIDLPMILMAMGYWGTPQIKENFMQKLSGPAKYVLFFAAVAAPLSLEAPSQLLCITSGDRHDSENAIS
jgi:hypothetical protein